MQPHRPLAQAQSCYPCNYLPGIEGMLPSLIHTSWPAAREEWKDAVDDARWCQIDGLRPATKADHTRAFGFFLLVVIVCFTPTSSQTALHNVCRRDAFFSPFFPFATLFFSQLLSPATACTEHTVQQTLILPANPFRWIDGKWNLLQLNDKNLNSRAWDRAYFFGSDYGAPPSR